MFDDEKIKLIRTLPEGDSIVIVWVQLLCLAGKINDGGAVYLGQNLAYTDEMLSTIFTMPLQIVRLALKTLHQFQMINADSEGVIDIANWEKHQNIDAMDKIREQTRRRVAKHRETKALEDSNVTVTFGNATEEEEEEDKNRVESSKSKPKKPHRKKYGEYQHILLTEAQHDKLVKDYSKPVTDEVIKKMDEWIQLKGKPYKDFNLAIRNWLKKDQAEQPKVPKYKDLGAE